MPGALEFMCVFIYITYLLLMKDTSSGNAEKQQHGMHAQKSGFKECDIFLEIVLWSWWFQAASRNDSFLSSNSVFSHFRELLYKWHVFSMLSLCIFSIWISTDNSMTIWLNCCPSIQKHISKFGTGEQTHFLKVSFDAL